MPKVARVVLGGTFDRLHAGHKALLSTAFRTGEPVAIGLTTDAYLRTHPKPRGGRIRPYAARRRTLTAWLRREFPGRAWTVVPLNDHFGRSVSPGVRVLIASVETHLGAQAVNRERRRRGLRPLRLVLVPLVLADDLRPVTSTRIRAGLIDPEGRRVAPIRIGVCGRDRTALRALCRAAQRAFRHPRIETQRPGGPARRTAIARARSWSRRALRGNELGFGVEMTLRPRPGVIISERSSSTELFPRRLEVRPPVPDSEFGRLLWPLERRAAVRGVSAKG